MPISEFLKHVVIVDDEIDLGNVLKDHFDSEGVERVEYFETAQLAYNHCVKMIQEDKIPHLILTDLTMPRMTGLEFLRKLRANDFLKGVPVIMMTAFGDEEKLKEAVKLGIEDFITKPFPFDFLNARLQAMLDRAIARAGSAAGQQS